MSQSGKGEKIVAFMIKMLDNGRNKQEFRTIVHRAIRPTLK
jgi:hypothetical protein